jgi:N-acetylglucosaminyl-diphospho-decaprenol L-rhamnosyltransferase
MRSATPVGVVIATRDRRERVLATLARVTALRDRPPVVLVDDGSADGTAQAVAQRFPGVDVVRLADGRGAAARNVGAGRLSTPYVAFLDDDSWWAPGALTRAAAVLDGDPRLAVLAARVLVGEEERLDPTCADMARTPLPGGAVLGFVACGAVVRRSAFLAVGGFDERYGIGGEEALLAVRLAAAGWELRYVPDVVAHHHPDPSANRRGRDARALRNDLWTTWSYLPLGQAAGATARLLRAAGARRSTLAGALAALRGLSWILRERRPAPPALAAQLRLLERQGAAGPHPASDGA